VLAFAAVYIVWGSTYLAIRFAIESIPPFLMAGARFAVAGLILVAWSRLRGAAWPTGREWGVALVTGSLLLLGGNGGVVWAEQQVPSSLAALIVSAVPLVTVALDWARPGGQRPGRATMLGLVTGFVGVAVLVNPGAGDAARVDPAGAAALLAATVSWSVGTLYSRRAKGAASPLMGAGANMLMGSVGLLAAGVVLGEPSRLDPAAVTPRSAAALIYLILVGAVIGFTAFFWLVRNTSTAKATTYAYVNPIVAIVLGWALAHEPVTPRVLVAATVIISGVVMITTLPHLKAVWSAKRARG
jgi:drug/metabolite transporter (DMT)-like permease